VHSVGAPVGGCVPPEQSQLGLLREVVTQLEAPWISEHLSFNSTGQFRTGFLLPPRQTWEGVDRAVSDIRHLQRSMTVPVSVETGVNYLQPRVDELADGDFVGAVVTEADCGLLLDLHNLFTNERNGRQPIESFMAAIPLDRVWEVHLAGGFELDGYWLDAHSGAVPDRLLAQAGDLIAEMPNLKAIVFEIFPAFVPQVGTEVIAAQLQRLHELWTSRVRRSSDGPRMTRANLRVRRPTETHVTPEAWEQALGSLVVGRAPDDALARELALDPGIELLRKLVCEFRASMTVSVLRLTSRLLMLALGQEVFQTVLRDYWAKVTPQLFAGSEAEAFGRYLEELGMNVPQLSEVLAFERAALATQLDQRSRVVSFDFDPTPMLLALAEGRLPDTPGTAGHFEIELTADGQPGLGDAEGARPSSVLYQH